MYSLQRYGKEEGCDFLWTWHVSLFPVNHGNRGGLLESYKQCGWALHHTVLSGWEPEHGMGQPFLFLALNSTGTASSRAFAHKWGEWSCTGELVCSVACRAQNVRKPQGHSTWEGTEMLSTVCLLLIREGSGLEPEP